MKLRDYLDNAIGECERRMWVLDLQSKTDVGMYNRRMQIRQTLTIIDARST